MSALSVYYRVLEQNTTDKIYKVAAVDFLLYVKLRGATIA